MAEQGNDYPFVPGRLLPIENIPTFLDANPDRPVEGEEEMRETLRKVRFHHYGHMQVPFPVYNVKHVTEKTALYGIWGEEGFKKTKYEKRPEFRDLLYWSADISSEDLEKARQQAYEKVRRVIVPSDDRKFSGELREQFGNSPAFKESVSRYGNFKFSFPLWDLLSWYKDQHCGGGEPQMKILGTKLYKLEIAHYIVVHSPTTDKFIGLPEVPAVQGSSDPLPFVYWMDGTLYWRPESTSIPLKVTVSEDGVVRQECFAPCRDFKLRGTCSHIEDGIYGVWNHLILAFHLPNCHLKIPKEKLLQNLTACDGDGVYLANENLNREVAEEVIQKLRDELESYPCS